MEQLIADVAAKTGVSPDVARKSLAIIINFLAHEAPPDRAAAMMDKLPGARALADEASGGGGGIMGVFNDLTAAGLGLTGVQQVARMFVAYARTHAGDDEVDGVVRAIPGLRQFI